jgi:hypothetical protein
MMRVTLLIVLTALSASFTYARTADALLKELRAKMTRAKSYTAQLKIKVDVPFMRVPDMTATLKHTAPDKTTIDAPGFAMLPKDGVDLGALKLLSKDFTAIDMGVENSMRKIKVLPSDESSDIVVATIWVDTTAMVARKVVSTTKKAGTVTIELSYDNAKARSYALPSFTKISMEMDALKIPKSISGDFDGNSRKPAAKPGPVKATVQVWYESYVIK